MAAMELNIKNKGRLVRELLIETADDPTRQGLLDTPARYAKEIDHEQRKNNE